MRILAITSFYPRPGRETHATFNRQQFAALQRRNAVRLIVPSPWPQVIAERNWGRTASNRRVNADGMEVEYATYFYPPRVMQSRYGHWYYHSIRRRTMQAIDEFKPDILYSCWAHPDGWATARLARESGLPCAIEVIGSDVLVLGRKPRRRRRIAEALSAADCVLAVSQDLARHVTDLGVPAERVHVVLKGVDRERFQPGNQQRARAELGLPPDGAMLLFVGNLLLSKGAGLLIEACRRLRERGVLFHARLVGRGQDETQLRAAVARYELGDRVSFAGPQPHELLPLWYQACDLVVLPSYSEGIPNVLNEALSCGRPFVATRAGGIPEIADSSYCELVEPGNVEELSDAIALMLASPRSVDLQAVAQRTVSWDQSADALTARLANIVDAAQKRQLEVGRDAQSAVHVAVVNSHRATL